MTIFGAVIGFFGFWYKARAESKKKNKLNLSEAITTFDLPRNDAFGHETISVSYNSKAYKNLVHYHAVAKNVGLTSIQNQNIFIELPSDFVEVSRKATTSSKAIILSDSASVDGGEITYIVERLEPGEYVSISILVDTCLPEQIKGKPRGVDNVEYSSEKKLMARTPDDIQVAIIVVGALFAVGTVPFIGPILQSVLIFVGAPIFSRAIQSIVSNKKQVEGAAGLSSSFGSQSSEENQSTPSVGEVNAQYVKH